MANAPMRDRFWNGRSEISAAISAGSMKRGSDLLLKEGDYEQARAIQMELLECQNRRLGPDDPETLAARDDLATILLTAPNEAPVV